MSQVLLIAESAPNTYVINCAVVGKNDETDGYIVTPNTKRLLAEHLQATGGKVSLLGIIIVMKVVAKTA